MWDFKQPHAWLLRRRFVGFLKILARLQTSFKAIRNPKAYFLHFQGYRGSFMGFLTPSIAKCLMTITHKFGASGSGFRIQALTYSVSQLWPQGSGLGLEGQTTLQKKVVITGPLQYPPFFKPPQFPHNAA